LGFLRRTRILKTLDVLGIYENLLDKQLENRIGRDRGIGYKGSGPQKSI